MSNVPKWVRKRLDAWGNWHWLRLDHEHGWPSEQPFVNADSKVDRGMFGSRVLVQDMPEAIREVDRAVQSLPDPMPDVIYAKHCLLRYPDGREVYDSDRAGWFSKGAGWFSHVYKSARFVLWGKLSRDDT